MKKIAVAFIVFVLWTVAAPCQPIIVSAPTGGEDWLIGSTQTITWTATGLGGNVKIILIKGTTSLGNIVDVVRANTGAYSWHVGDHLTNGATYSAGADYFIQVQSRDEWRYKDRNNQAFTISAPPSVQVVYPNGGERIGLPTTVRIRWTASPSIAHVKIIGKKPGDTYEVTPSTPNTGFYDLALDESPQDGLNYKIRVEDAAHPAVFDESNAAFELYHTGPAYINIIKPVGDTKYIGTEYYILWERGGFDLKVRVELWKGVHKVGTISSSTTDTQKNWRIDNLPDGAVTPGDDYFIKITALHASGCKASSAHFSIATL